MTPFPVNSDVTNRFFFTIFFLLTFSFSLLCYFQKSTFIVLTVSIILCYGLFRWSNSKKITVSNPNEFKVAIIGAGFSGINAAIECKRFGIPFVLFEKDKDIGGTWWANKYPGCECDIASHLYSFSFELNPNWSKKYSGQEEIRNYIKHCTKKYNIEEDIKTSHKVNQMTWDQSEKKWILEIENEKMEVFKDNFRFVILGSGPLSKPNIPKQFNEGLNIFKGCYFHTAQWREDFEPTGRKIAIIGNAASALQLVPKIANETKELFIFQRTANWVIPKLDYYYPSYVKTIFRYVPFLMTLHRWYIYWTNEITLQAVLKKGKLNNELRDKISNFIQDYFDDKDLAKKLTPNFEVGCKRILLSYDLEYYQVLKEKKAQLITDTFEIGEDGIITENKKFDVDTIIMATGFDLISDGSTTMKIIGKNGKNFHDITANKRKCYLGITTRDFPNLFVMVGPQTGLGHSSIIFMIENQVNYSIKLIRESIENGKREIEVKEETVENYYNKEINSYYSNKVWNGCNSWYRDSNGVIFALWPRHTFTYWWKCLVAQYTIFNDYEST